MQVLETLRVGRQRFYLRLQIAPVVDLHSWATGVKPVRRKSITDNDAALAHRLKEPIRLDRGSARRQRDPRIGHDFRIANRIGRQAQSECRDYDTAIGAITIALTDEAAARDCRVVRRAGAPDVRIAITICRTLDRFITADNVASLSSFDCPKGTAPPSRPRNRRRFAKRMSLRAQICEKPEGAVERAENEKGGNRIAMTQIRVH